jgi:hypothetical protein
MGLTTHDNPYDFVTIDPAFVLPSAGIQKPVGYTFDQWLEKWGAMVKA